MKIRIRIKTEAEFKASDYWIDSLGTPKGWNDYKKMNHYLGMEIPENAVAKVKDCIDKDNYVGAKDFDSNFGTNWSFNPNNFIVTEEQEIEKINMERVNKEFWVDTNIQDNFIGVEMRTGNKYFLMPNESGCVPFQPKNLMDNSVYIDYQDVESILITTEFFKGQKKVFKFNTQEDILKWIS